MTALANVIVDLLALVVLAAVIGGATAVATFGRELDDLHRFDID
jgi:hypothetical protein